MSPKNLFSEGNSLLALEASDLSCSVAVHQKGEALENILSLQSPSNGDGLLGLIEKILAQKGMALGELNAICMTNGPTSFTALRINFAIARALESCLSIPVYGIDCLLATVMRMSECPQEIWVAKSAYKKEYYFAKFIMEEGLPRLSGKISCQSPERILDNIPASAPILLSPKKSKEKAVPDAFLERNRLEEESLTLAPAEAVLRFFLKLPLRHLPKYPANPVYVRAPEAVLNYAEKFGVKSPNL